MLRLTFAAVLLALCAGTLCAQPEEFRPVTLYGAYSLPDRVVARGQLLFRREEIPLYASVTYTSEDGSSSGFCEARSSFWRLAPDRVELDITLGGETTHRTFRVEEIP